jgi:hypothetical protein
MIIFDKPIWTLDPRITDGDTLNNSLNTLCEYREATEDCAFALLNIKSTIEWVEVFILLSG